ncbi:MAG: lysoplasmalogenase family protein [Spirochaetaceae bacterium]|nr:lysoplasmalogenase family protein [Spirochaetaceae bacterium]
MGNYSVLWRILPPAAVIVAFCLHWLTLKPAQNSAERLVLSRGAYLGMSAQLVAYAFIAFAGGYRPAAILGTLGMAASFAGDVLNLQFPLAKDKLGEPLAWGILAFIVAQLCYIAAFLSLVPLVELVARGAFVPILAVALVLPALAFRLRVYSPDRPRNLMILAFVYGFPLGTMVAVALSAAIALGGAWVSIAAGAVLFLVSDASMGETTIAGRHPIWEYQISWMTYLCAQGLILFGASIAAA